MHLALETDSLDAIADRIASCCTPETASSLLDKLKLLPKLAEIGSFFPKSSSRRSALQASHPRGEDVDLTQLPVLKPGRRTAAASSHCPASSRAIPVRQAKRRHVPHAGLRRPDHRNALAAPEERRRTHPRAPARCRRDRRAGRHHGADRRRTHSAGTGRRLDSADRAHQAARQSRMEVAVAIGTDPATTFSAIVPAPPEVEEYIIAGFLRQSRWSWCKCETVDLEVPAHAEIVLEGYVKLGELRTEGPFGDHTGFYTMPDDTRSSTSPASPIARTPSTQPPSSASRPWRMHGWGRPSSASSCR